MSLRTPVQPGQTTSVRVVESLPANDISQLRVLPNQQRVIRRLKKGCTLFFKTWDEEPAGWYWGIKPNGERIWHDKVPIDPNTVFLFNAFVPPHFRGRGIYRELIRAAICHYTERATDPEIAIIVEHQNEVSKHINEALGFKTVRYNYLIKIYKRNVLSIFTNPLRIYWVLTGESSHSL